MQPVCSRCKVPVEPLRAVITGKAAGAWKCPICNTKCTQLSRIFGCWPPKAFSTTPAEWQEKFYRELADKPGGATLEKFVVDSLV